MVKFGYLLSVFIDLICFETYVEACMCLMNGFLTLHIVLGVNIQLHDTSLVPAIILGFG